MNNLHGFGTAGRRCIAIAWSMLGLMALAAQAQSLRFYGNGVQDIDRVKIRIDDPALAFDAGPPADVGAGDFTIELWIKATGDNRAAAITCGSNYNWIWGNALLDRDRFNAGRKYGITLTAGRVAFGVSNAGLQSHTLCSSSDLRDNSWHHIAVQRRRSDGYLWLFVDGSLRAQGDGPDGDISYPDDARPGYYCGPSGSLSCNSSDPFIVLGAEKHDYDRSSAPPFFGWMDELRISNTLRYAGTFTPARQAFTPDGATAALYHFDEGVGNDVIDSTSGNRSAGVRRYGGNPPGPQWTSDSPFTTSSAGQLRLSSSTYSGAEGSGVLTLVVSRSGGTQGAATAEIWVDSGSAVYGADYSPSYGTVSWSSGQGGDRTLQVNLIDDGIAEASEQATVALRNVTGALPGSTTSATLTILDNDSSSPPPASPGTLAFEDSFARADGAALQNNWIEKQASAFALSAGRARKGATSTGYRDNLIYRPASESVLDVQASVEMTVSATPVGYPVVLARLQSASAGAAGSFHGYLLSITSNTGRALISRQNGSGWDTALASFTLSEAIQANAVYRLSLRASGTQPVQLLGSVERFTGGSWRTIGQASYADSSGSRIATAGVVGLSGDVEGSYAFDNFRRIDY